MAAAPSRLPQQTKGQMVHRTFRCTSSDGHEVQERHKGAGKWSRQAERVGTWAARKRCSVPSSMHMAMTPRQAP